MRVGDMFPSGRGITVWMLGHDLVIGSFGNGTTDPAIQWYTSYKMETHMKNTHARKRNAKSGKVRQQESTDCSKALSNKTALPAKDMRVKPPGAGYRIKPKDLSGLHVLRQIILEEIWDLIKESPVHLLKKGDVLINKGQTNAVLYLIARGRLSVNLEEPRGKAVAFIESGQTVGEMSVMDHRPTSAFVVATRPTLALAIDEDTFWRLIAASHQFSKNMFVLLTQRLRASNLTLAENIRLCKLLEHHVTVDGLTGLRNRRWLDENLPRLISRHKKAGSPLSLIMFDVDHFKKFNDTYGHGAGDRVLTTVGRAIETKLRPSDFGVRYGGEEFTVILPDTDLAGGFVTAERLRQTISCMPIQTLEGTDLPPVNISLGVGQLNNKDSPAKLLKRVDEALYRAKKRGRNCTEPA
jgi:diguanylate cyclase (GGDEF)-like protein